VDSSLHGMKIRGRYMCVGGKGEGVGGRECKSIYKYLQCDAGCCLRMCVSPIGYFKLQVTSTSC